MPRAYRTSRNSPHSGGFIGRWWKVAAAAILITVASASGFAAGRMRAPAQVGYAGAIYLTDMIVEDWGWQGNGLDALVEVIED